MKINLLVDGKQNIIAKFEGEGSERIERLVGTKSVATPFSLAGVSRPGKYRQLVLQIITERNPGVEVVWHGCHQ